MSTKITPIYEGKIIFFNTFTKETQTFQFPRLDECFKFRDTNNIKISSRDITIEFASEYIETLQDKITKIGKVIENVELIDGRKFKRELNVRIDDTHHNDTNTHLNIDAITSSINKHDNHKKLLGEFHFVNISPIAYAIYITMVWPGKILHQPIVIFPSKIDKNYHEAERVYLEKLKEANITENEKIKFKQIFDDYVKYIKSKVDN